MYSWEEEARRAPGRGSGFIKHVLHAVTPHLPARKHPQGSHAPKQWSLPQGVLRAEQQLTLHSGEGEELFLKEITIAQDSDPTAPPEPRCQGKVPPALGGGGERRGGHRRPAGRWGPRAGGWGHRGACWETTPSPLGARSPTWGVHATLTRRLSKGYTGAGGRALVSECSPSLTSLS